jgi:archaemetzincin
MSSRKKILVAPIGDVDKEIITDLSSNLRDIMSCDVEILEPVEKPEHAYNPTRDQFRSTDLLSKLRRQVFGEGGKDRTAVRVLGVADVDLYIAGLDFVFGEADLPGRTAIISLKRLGQEFYSLTPDRRVLLKRATREAVHGLGHIFGLGHCINQSCVMYPSSSVEETDKKGSGFCERCQQHIGGAVAQRERI